MASFTGFLNTIILLGIVQGFIMSWLLYTLKKQRYANQLLATLILLITLASIKLYGEYQNWFGSDIARFISDILPMITVMPFGPLIYFYVKAYLDPNFKISKKQRLHFLPVIIDFVPSISIIGFMLGLLFKMWKPADGSAVGNFIDTYNVYADVPRWASVCFYVWLSIKHIKATRAKHVTETRGELPAGIKWLQQLTRVMLVFQSIWFVFLVPYVVPQLSNKLLDAVDWYPLYIPMAIIVYFLGIKGYMASALATTAPQQAKKTISVQASLSPAAIGQAVELLQTAMQADRLYLNPNLNVELVAQHISLPPKTVSAVLNQHLNKSFNEFINGYRVQAFKEKVLLPEMDNFTIAGIANECGFNSQATFQRTFKQVTGMSPTEYRKREPIVA